MWRFDGGGGVVVKCGVLAWLVWCRCGVFLAQGPPPRLNACAICDECACVCDMACALLRLHAFCSFFNITGCVRAFLCLCVCLYVVCACVRVRTRVSVFLFYSRPTTQHAWRATSS